MRKNSYDVMRPFFESLCMPIRPPPSGPLQCSSIRTPFVVPVQMPAIQASFCTDAASAARAVGVTATSMEMRIIINERMRAASGKGFASGRDRITRRRVLDSAHAGCRPPALVGVFAPPPGRVRDRRRDRAGGQPSAAEPRQRPDSHLVTRAVPAGDVQPLFAGAVPPWARGTDDRQAPDGA